VKTSTSHTILSFNNKNVMINILLAEHLETGRT